MKKTISAIIVDDEMNSRIVLKSLLVNYFPEVEIVAEASSAESAFALINEFSPQLVFLDIQMPGGDGFSLLKKWEQLPFDVIFVTSFDQFAINAIRFSALDYLLKPVDISDLRLAVARAIDHVETREQNRILIENLKENMNGQVNQRKIAIHVKDKVRLISVSNISYVMADSSWCNLFNETGERFVMAKNLKEMQEMLMDYPDFVRIHKSYLINVRYISDYSKGDPCILTMIDGKTFEVARRKKSEILERLNRI